MEYSSTNLLPSMESLVAGLTAERLGSFSAAALELGVTHAAISRRIEALENWAGQRIFERQARGVQVTETGQRVLARLGHALEQIQVARKPRGGSFSLPVVRISVTPSFAQMWLIPRIGQIEGTPASLRIEVHADLKHADILSGEADLAIRYGRGNWNAGNETKLFDEVLCPALSPSLLKTLKIVDAQTIAKLPLLHVGDATGWREWSKKHYPRVKSKESDRTFGGYAQCIEAARAGLGVVLWNHRLHAQTEDLILFDELCITSPLSHYLLSRSAHPDSPPGVLESRILKISKNLSL